MCCESAVECCLVECALALCGISKTAMGGMTLSLCAQPAGAAFTSVESSFVGELNNRVMQFGTRLPVLDGKSSTTVVCEHLSGNAVAPVTLVEQLTRASWYLASCCSHDNVLCALLACCLDVCALLCLAQSQKYTSGDNKLFDLRCYLCALNQNYLCPWMVIQEATYMLHACVECESCPCACHTCLFEPNAQESACHVRVKLYLTVSACMRNCKALRSKHCA